jgi:hypothetical protein
VDASVSGGERETPVADEQQARERGLDALLLARSNQEPRVSGAAASDGKCPLGVGSGGWLEGDLVAERFELA